MGKKKRRAKKELAKAKEVAVGKETVARMTGDRMGGVEETGMARRRAEIRVLWEKSRSEEELERETGRLKRLMEETGSGMRKCRVCGGEARIELLGRDGRGGVFVGCWGSRDCARRGVLREDGDIEKACGEWNRRNGGIVGWLVEKGMILDRWLNKVAEKMGERRLDRAKAMAMRKLAKARRKRERGKGIGIS